MKIGRVRAFVVSRASKGGFSKREIEHNRQNDSVKAGDVTSPDGFTKGTWKALAKSRRNDVSHHMLT